LNSSNGSRHALQTWIALHAVDPNSLFSAVLLDPQRGQTAAARRRAIVTSPPCSAGPGGAIP
jgi:hypothetical protein